MRGDGRRLPGTGLPQTLFSLMASVEERIRHHFRGTNLHWGLRRILRRLWLEDGVSQRELADAVGSSEASISNMLKHLTAGNWVERRQDTYDYRIARIHLTDKAMALRQAIIDELSAIDRTLREALGNAEASSLESLLHEAAELLGGTFDDDGDDCRFKTLAEHPSPPGEL